MKVNNASFRDESGFIFEKNGVLYRQINPVYAADYELLFSLGLYEKLVSKKYLIPHEEVSDFAVEGAYKIIRPTPIPFISYPSSWSFSMLKEAALLTLKIQKLAVAHGMILKDASIYNIQFVGYQAIFIDTLSFEKLEEGEAWVAYGQFCRHFLAPILLMSYTDIGLNKLLQLYIDGVPLDVAAKILPWKSKWNLGNYLHLFLHAKTHKKHENTTAQKSEKKPIISKKSLLNIAESLKTTISKTTLHRTPSEWNDYYEKDVSKTYFIDKERVVKGFFGKTKAKTVLDLGANDGTFSRFCAEKSDYVLSFDIDAFCVEDNFQALKKDKIKNILPLVFDAANPEPAFGWANEERTSIWERTNVDTILALAIVHHLAISNNLPFEKIAKKLSEHCQYLIIEFVPKTDEKVQRLLMGRKDIFHDYTQEKFEFEFFKYFNLVEKTNVGQAERVMYLLNVKLFRYPTGFENLSGMEKV